MINFTCKSGNASNFVSTLVLGKDSQQGSKFEPPVIVWDAVPGKKH